MGTFNIEVSQAQERLYALRLKMGVIEVGADSELSQKLIKDAVDDAIKACKISKESRDAWVSMAGADFDTAKTALDSIPAREDISAAIAGDKNNQEHAGEAPHPPMEREILAKVKSVVGEEFQYLEPKF